MDDRHELIGGLAALVGGLAFVVVPLFVPLHGMGTLHVSHILLVVAVLLIIVGIWSFQTAFRPSYTRVGRGGLWLLGVGTLGLLPFTLLELIARGIGGAILIGTFTIVAVAVVMLGALGVAIDAYRTRVPTPWLSIWLPGALLIPFLFIRWNHGISDWLWLGSNPTAAFFGLAWIGFGYSVLRHSTRLPEPAASHL